MTKKIRNILLITVFVLVPLCAFAGNIDPVNKFAYGENIGWVNLEPLQGSGVTVTNAGLSGNAWGENIGWINLSPTNGVLSTMVLAISLAMPGVKMWVGLTLSRQGEG